MAGAVKEKEPSAFGISPRAARALADPWRLRILAEVSVRPLSPSQFEEEFGGELTHIARCFRQLAKWDYIEVVEERLGRRQGAAVEHIYRAVRRAHFDASTWQSVPRGERDEASREIIGSYRNRIREAREGGTFDRESDRHLSWDVVALDQRAWQEVGRSLDRMLESLPEYEVASHKRLTRSGEEGIPTTVGLASFCSPEKASELLTGSLRQQSPIEISEAGAAIGPKFAKALSNRWRCKIVAETSVRPLSPSKFVDEFGGSMTHISRCFRELAKWGYLEVLEERKGGRRGGVERVYRSTRRAYFGPESWEALPELVREEISLYFLETFFDRVTDAIEVGTFDARLDRHLSWKPVVLDRQAWREIGADLDAILESLPRLEAQSLERVDEVEDLVTTTVGLAAFRSPIRGRGSSNT